MPWIKRQKMQVFAEMAIKPWEYTKENYKANDDERVRSYFLFRQQFWDQKMIVEIIKTDVQKIGEHKISRDVLLRDKCGISRAREQNEREH